MKIEVKARSDGEIVAVFLPSHDSSACGKPHLYLKTGDGGAYEVFQRKVVNAEVWKLCCQHALNDSNATENWMPIYEGDSVEIHF